MNNTDHDLALHVFQSLHSITWDMMIIMNQWSSATPDEPEQDEGETIAFESEVRPLLRSMVVTLEQFPVEAFNGWKVEVLKVLGADFDDTALDQATRRSLQDEPQGVAIACNEALIAVNMWIDEVLQRLGASGWNGMMSAWDRTLRKKLSKAENRLSEAIEQLTVNPMFASYLRKRALHMISVTEVEMAAKESSDAADFDSQEGQCLDEPAWDDEEVTTDLTQIDPEFRTKPLGKAQAAAYLGRTGDAGRKWINKCIKDGTIKCVRLTRQSYVFDSREFPGSVMNKVRPTAPKEKPTTPESR